MPALAQDIRVYPIQSPAPKHAHTLIPDGKTEAQKQEVTCPIELVPKAWTPLRVWLLPGALQPVLLRLCFLHRAVDLLEDQVHV